jgi:hypothetical protein
MKNHNPDKYPRTVLGEAIINTYQDRFGQPYDEIETPAGYVTVFNGECGFDSTYYALELVKYIDPMENPAESFEYANWLAAREFYKDDSEINWSIYMKEMQELEGGLTKKEKTAKTQAHHTKLMNQSVAEVLVSMLNKVTHVRNIDMMLLAMIMCQITVDQLKICLFKNYMDCGDFKYYGCEVQQISNLGISYAAERHIREMFKIWIDAQKEYGSNNYRLNEMYVILEAAPKNTIAGNIWRDIGNAELGSKQDHADNDTVHVDKLPAEDMGTWRKVYGTKAAKRAIISSMVTPLTVKPIAEIEPVTDYGMILANWKPHSNNLDYKTKLEVVLWEQLHDGIVDIPSLNNIDTKDYIGHYGEWVVEQEEGVIA